ncbi:hypothetical protein SAMN05444166_7620 [Singulisphaera sp. GP187]|nr:hypothetical protein SAMN05444166_7620 [Singulisphaera sp. GP187]
MRVIVRLMRPHLGGVSDWLAVLHASEQHIAVDQTETEQSAARYLDWV